MSELIHQFERLLAGGEPRTSLDTLLQLMTPSAAQQLRLCAIPHEFNPAILSVLAPELDEAEAQARFREFAELSTVIPVPDGLALHDSARAELFGQWLKPEREREFRDANRRMVAYCDGRAAEPGAAGEARVHRRMFHRIGADPSRGFAEFEALCRQARHETRWTACSNLIRLVHEYDPVLTSEQAAWLAYHEAKLAVDLQHWDEAEQLLTVILNDAHAPAALAVKARLRMGMLASQRGDLDGAISQYEQAHSLLMRTGPQGTERHDVLRSLGEAYRDRREYERAQQLLTESLSLAEEAADEGAIADTWNSLGTLHWMRRDIAEAAAAYHTSLDHLLRMNRRFQSAQVHNNLGMIYAHQRDWSRAEESYRTSLQIKREAGDSLGQARTLINLAQVYRGRQEVGSAVEACAQAIRLFDEVRHPLGSARANRTLGRLYLAQDAAGQSREALERAAEIFASCAAHKEAAETREELAAMGREVRIPWWAWLAIAPWVLLLAGLLALALVAALR